MVEGMDIRVVANGLKTTHVINNVSPIEYLTKQRMSTEIFDKTRYVHFGA